MEENKTFEYHDDIKQQYINSRDGNWKRVLLSRISKINNYELKCGKDMLDWSLDDYDGFYASVSQASVHGIASYKTTILDLGRLICKEKGLDDSKIKKMEQVYSIDKLRDYIPKDSLEKQLITHYDYERIVSNTVPGVTLVPIEQVFFIVFWHDLVASPNDIFNTPMSMFHLNEKYAIRHDGTRVDLNNDEVMAIRKFKQEQTITKDVKRARKPLVTVGTIEIDSSAVDGTTYLLIEQDSDLLIPPILGREFYRNYGLQASVKDEPLQVRFGRLVVNVIVEQINDKLGMDFKAISIVRSGMYDKIIKDKQVKLGNLKQFSGYELFPVDLPGRTSYSKNELHWILTRTKEQEYEAKARAQGKL